MKFPDSYFESEVREGFFVAGMMKRAWAAQLEVLSDIDRVCRKHQIRWFADAGTLLGAVRHRGYIPWDDDLDICMKREDYNRFLTVAGEELPRGYFLHNIYTDENYSELFTRVLNSNVINFEKEFLEKFHGCPYGMGIDVFAMDYIAPSLEEEEAQFALIGTIVRIIEEIDTGVFEQKAMMEWADEIEKIFQVKLDPARSVRNQILLLAEQIFSLYSEKEAKELTIMQLWMRNRAYRMPKSYYQTTVMLPFENIKVPAPAVYDAVLTKKFRNYMVQVRSGGVHDYPFYKKQEIALQQQTGECPYTYRIVKEEVTCGRKRVTVSLKKQIRERLQLMQNLHDKLRLSGAKNMDGILKLLAKCQENAIALGTLIEEAKGEGTDCVGKLEEYCETIYQTYQEIAEGRMQEFDVKWVLSDHLAGQIRSQVKTEVDMRYEAVFFPHKADAWDALESVWKAADQDPDCNAYVVVIPYFYKKSDQSIGEIRYEADLFPNYVPITAYDKFDLKKHCPETIYFQNPYDQYDSAISVHPFFYSENLKKYTENLVYIPYFLSEEILPGDNKALENIRYCCVTPGVVHADKVVVQSENMRQIYIDILTKEAGEETRGIWEKKILGLGSPKMDKTLIRKKEEMDIPKEWLQIIKKPDGSLKKIVLYGTDQSVLLYSGMKSLEKMERVFTVLKERKDKIALIWFPCQWAGTKMETAGAEVLKKYDKLKQKYQSEGWGILDESGDMERVVLLCDAYYGDGGCLAQLCLKKNIPVMIQNVESESS